MKYIKLFENWLNPEDHMDKIDSTIDKNAKTEKNKLGDKQKNQSGSKPFSIKSSKWVRLETDKVEGKTDAQSKNTIVISNDRGKTGLGVFMYIEDISQSYENLSINLSIQVVGASPCVDTSCEMKILFTDGVRLSKYGVNRYNCDQRAIFSLSFSEIEKFKSTKIETLRVYTSLGKYVQLDLTPKNQEDFINTINDFSNYMDTLIDLNFSIKTNRVDMVKSLLSSGIDPNTKNYQGYYPIHKAAEKNTIDIVKMLIEKGADVNVRYLKSTPLHITAEKNHLEIAQMLIDAKADLNLQNYGGMTALHLATKNNYIEIVKLLIDAKSDLNIQDEKGMTALHLATKNNYIEIAKLLIDAKADLNIQENELLEWTPLHFAARYNQIEIAKMLIGAGARKDIEDQKYKTPYIYAQTKGLQNLLKP
jgi:ankyrin repeat protein